MIVTCQYLSVCTFVNPIILVIKNERKNDRLNTVFSICILQCVQNSAITLHGLYNNVAQQYF